MNTLRSIQRLLTKLCFSVCAISLASVIVLIVIEIVARNLFDSSTYVQVEVSGYLIAFFTVYGMAVAIGSGDILSITVLTDLPAIRRYPRTVSAYRALLGMIVLGFACWHFYRNAARDFTRGNTSGTLLDVPLWIPEAILTAGLAICAVSALLQMVLANSAQQEHEA